MESTMFSTDPHFLLALHHSHAEELRAEADADRLARAVRRAEPARTRFGRGRRCGTAASRAPAMP
ncbi:hypothetical protein [Plantactinospora sp. CA-290183]|uniref:hypothetical protein n=1 Tax=Plantactinospora sp. CA-290183 TaxID=3240006 RepID=UPI003D8A4A1B